MLNFRYHVVSLVAVFLALAVGIIAGSTVVDQGVVRALERTQDALERRQDQLEAENATLRERLAASEAFGEALAPETLRGRLRGHRGVLVVEPGVDPAVVQAVEDALSLAGAAPAGLVSLSDRWTLADETSSVDLETAIAATAADETELLGQAARALAGRLREPGEPADDLLSALADAGFLSLDRPARDPFPPEGTLLVYVASGLAEAGPAPPDAFTVPFMRAAAGAMPVAAVEPVGARDSIAARVRGDAELAVVVATVDHIDTFPGRLALVAGLADLVAGLRAPHYGVGRGATSIAPLP